MKVVIDIFDEKSISRAISDLEGYKSDFKKKADELCMRLASAGAVIASMSYASVGEFVSDDGPPQYSINVEQKGDSFFLTAEGEDVLYLEFGSGDRYGWGHPDVDFADGHYGPGTNSVKGHWDDPKGWWTPQGHHTYGNAPTAGMWRAKEEIIDNVQRMAEEIFNG